MLAVQHYPHMLQRTYHPSDACLLIIAPDSCSNTNASELLQHLYDYGRNHFIWDNGNCAGGYPDDPFDVTMNYQYAALANGAMTDDIVRRGYDVPLPRVAHSSMLLRTTRLPVDDAPRHYLLSFKGTINDWPQFWYYHRWMAVEYWNHTTSTTTKAKESDIVVDVQCDDGGRNYTSSDYVTLLLNSTFGFAPGGASVGSYRFGEVLGLGGIPVVLQDFVSPMWPELDWSGCILKVSEARLVDLPRILRAISKEEIRSRQQRCKVLFQQTIGWKKVGIEMWEIDNGVRSFLTAMKVWNWRIQDYHAKQMRQTAFD
jgi:Exostosin family